MSSNRIIIYPKDVQRITGRSERTGRALLRKIKKAYNKTNSQFVTINEFASFTGLTIEEIQKHLID